MRSRSATELHHCFGRLAAALPSTGKAPALIEEEPRGPIAAPLSRLARRSHDLGVPMPRNGDRCRTYAITKPYRPPMHAPARMRASTRMLVDSPASRHQRGSRRRRLVGRRGRRPEVPRFHECGARANHNSRPIQRPANSESRSRVVPRLRPALRGLPGRPVPASGGALSIARRSLGPSVPADAGALRAAHSETADRCAERRVRP